MGSEEILKTVKLPTLSRTLYEIIELEQRNPISFAQDIRKIIEMDPLLSAHVLKVANSPLYGFSQKVRTLSHAIGLLGVRRIRTIAFSFSIFDFFKQAQFQPRFGSLFNLVLKKSLLISAISTILARKIEYPGADELYVSGLLADIGQLILCLHSPQKYTGIYSSIDAELIPRERQTFHTDHVELGCAFCLRWSFPEFIKNGIREHARLDDDSFPSKISYIANQLGELLLTDTEKEKERIFSEIENNTKKLLHLSISDVEETVNTLPQVLDTYISDFPEVQKDLNQTIKAGSNLIINLMKKEMDMVLLTQELTDSQKKLAKEKLFLSHMLNLSYFFSSLLSPHRLISSLFEYFENFITDFTIEFIHRELENDEFVRLTRKDDLGAPILLENFPSLHKARLSNEPMRLEPKESRALDISGNSFTLVFPISYHNNFFGFLLLRGDSEQYLAFDLEVSYVQILANIIANSFQNYFSFQDLKKEVNKKEMITRELFKFDEELDQSRQLLNRLQKSELISEMLPVIFHKLKNKLTPILGYAQILMTKTDDEKLKQRIEKIERNATELSEQLNQLRDYFKGDEEPSPTRENINSIINRMDGYFKELESRKNLVVEVELDLSILDDALLPGQIESLILNLTENAVCALQPRFDKGERGIIRIITRRDKDAYLLIIRDNGVGIPKNDIPLLWAPFQSNFPGHTGLGLSICERIIANHEAKVHVESEEGQFTEFRIRFTPRLNLPSDERLAFDSRKEKIHGKILIVDDEAYLLDLMKEILLNGGNFDITTTTRGREALRMIDSSFDLIISDVRMPEVNGMDIYDYLKTRHMESKIILVTADPFSQDIAEFLQANRVDFLRKPFELMEFKKRVIDKLS